MSERKQHVEQDDSQNVLCPKPQPFPEKRLMHDRLQNHLGIPIKSKGTTAR